MNRYIFELARSLVMFNSSTEEIKEEFELIRVIGLRVNSILLFLKKQICQVF